MIQSAVVIATRSDSADAGRDMATQITEVFDGAQPDAVIAFASSRHDYRSLLRAMCEECRPKCLVGASSAGEFTRNARGEGITCALALRSNDMMFSVGVGRSLRADRVGAAREIVSGFQGREHPTFPHRAALVLTDSLAGHADDLVDQLTFATAGRYQFFGGGAGDDAQFKRTHVFAGTEPITDAAVALEILSKKPIGIGVSHGWVPASSGMRVTEADGARLVSLNGMPAVQLFQDHAEGTGQHLNARDPLPFFLHNIIGIETGNGHRLRVPLAIHDDGSISCAAEVPSGSLIHIMKASVASAADAAARATRTALEALEGNKPKVGLFFDCVATRLRMGDLFGLELGALAELLDPAPFVGCNTYGQIARAAGQFGGFHNCTAVVCVFPD